MHRNTKGTDQSLKVGRMGWRGYLIKSQNKVPSKIDILDYTEVNTFKFYHIINTFRIIDHH